MKDCRVVEIPAIATEDRVAGYIDIEAALKDGEKQFQPGLLKEADGNILSRRSKAVPPTPAI